MERYYEESGGWSRWLPVMLGVVCLLTGVPLYLCECLKMPEMAGLRVLCGLMGMTGLILTPFAILTRCFDHWDRYK